jgi:hypothetical protein
MATSKTATATTAPVQHVHYHANAVMANGKPISSLRANTARTRFCAMAQAHNGKPLAAFAAAFAAGALAMHGPKSVFTARQQAQAFSGWLAWAVRNNIVTVK